MASCALTAVAPDFKRASCRSCVGRSGGRCCLDASPVRSPDGLVAEKDGWACNGAGLGGRLCGNGAWCAGGIIQSPIWRAGRSAFAAAGGLAAIGFIAEYVFLPALPVKQRVTLRDMVSIFKVRNAQVGFAAIVLIASGQFVPYTILSTYFQEVGAAITKLGQHWPRSLWRRRISSGTFVGERAMAWECTPRLLRPLSVFGCFNPGSGYVRCFLWACARTHHLMGLLVRGGSGSACRSGSTRLRRRGLRPENR